jgi:hypothetical protein
VRPLAPSPAWTVVTPYCKRTRPGRGTNTKAAGFPPLSRPTPATFRPPSRSASRRPIWAGARGYISLVGLGTPRSRNADTNLGKDYPIFSLNLMLLVSSYLSKAYQLNLEIVFPPYLIRY